MDSELLRERAKEFLSGIMKGDEQREKDVGNSFVRELTVIDKALELLLQGFLAISEDDRGAGIRFEVHLLLSRLFNHLVAARKLILMGYMTESATLLARALETNWLALFLNLYPDEVEKWSDKGIKPRELKERLEIPKTEIDLWNALNEHGHPNFSGAIPHINIEKSKTDTPTLTLGGYPTEHSLKNSFKGLALVQWSSLNTMASVFNEFFDRNAAPWLEQYQLVVQEITGLFDDA